MTITPISDSYFDKTFAPLINHIQELGSQSVAIYGIDPGFAYLDFVLAKAGVAVPKVVAFFDQNYRKLANNPLSRIAPIYGPGSLQHLEFNHLLVLPPPNDGFENWLGSFNRTNAFQPVYISPNIVTDLMQNLRHYLRLRKSELHLAAEKLRDTLNYPADFAAKNYETASHYIDNCIYWNIRSLTHYDETVSVQSETAKDYRVFIAEVVENYTKQNDPILDFGCGPGTGIEHLLGKLPHRNYRGADVSWRQVEKAREVLDGKVQIDHINGINLEYNDRSFRLSYTSSVFDHISYPEVIFYFRELCRVTQDYIFLMEPADNIVKGYNSNCFGNGYNFDHNYEGLLGSLGFELKEAFPTHMGSNLVGMLFQRATP